MNKYISTPFIVNPAYYHWMVSFYIFRACEFYLRQCRKRAKKTETSRKNSKVERVERLHRSTFSEYLISFSRIMK